MDIYKILSIKGIYRGNSGQGHQYYQILITDNDGKEYLTSISCKHIYQESCEKTFGRLIFIPAPSDEELIMMQSEVKAKQELSEAAVQSTKEINKKLN